MQDLTGKVAVVTGAASGIGRAMVRRFATEGMKVVIGDIEEPPLEQLGIELSAEGFEVLAVPTDVSVFESVKELADKSFDRFGAVHVVCNNAGVAGGGLSWEQPISFWEWVLGVNLWGVIHGIRAFVPSLVAQGEGHVVNTASLAGLLPAPGMSAYCASKHAVVAISESLLHELTLMGSSVKVSALCPGFVNTNIADADRNWLPRLGPPPDPTGPAATSTMPGAEVIGEVFRQMIASGLAPMEVADAVLEAITKERFWVFTHHELTERAADRMRGAARGENPELNFLV